MSSVACWIGDDGSADAVPWTHSLPLECISLAAAAEAGQEDEDEVLGTD